MDLRSELHEALDVEDFPSRGLLTQTIARFNEPRPRRTFAAAPAIAAALIAGALVVTLVAVNLNGATTSIGPPLPTASSIDNLVNYHFASPEVGWVHVYAGNDVVARTSDGGETWHRQLSVAGLDRTPTMQWIDANNGVLIGQKGDDGVVWKTRDGGAHWQSHVVTWSNLPGTRHPPHWTGATGYFVDANHGWVMFRAEVCTGSTACPPSFGSDWAVYATVDGGEHWRGLSLLTTLQGSEVSVQFVTQSTGLLLVGRAPVLARYSPVGWSPILTTQDGGSHWSSSQALFSAPVCGRANCNYESMQTAMLFSADEAAMVGTLLELTGCPRDMRCPPHALTYRPVERGLFEAMDGGRRWRTVHNLPASMDPIVFIDSNHLFQIGPQLVTSSADRGATWSPVGTIPIPASWYVNKAQFVDSRHGWVTLANYPLTRAVSDSGANPQFSMLATSDGGVTWHQMSLPEVEAISPTGGTSAQPR
jgi:photosystem II stability/assembly factor-like uncharacterized protein